MNLCGLLITVIFWQCCHGWTNVSQCKVPAGKSPPLEAQVNFAECDQPPCPVKKGTNMTIMVMFTADKDYDNLLNSVKGTVLGITTGYPGLDGGNSCNFMYTPEEEKATCPLKAGQTYLFKISGMVLRSTPKVIIPVRCAVRDKTTKTDILCFEVQAKIT